MCHVESVFKNIHKIVCSVVMAVLLAGAQVATAAEGLEREVTFNIAPQALDAALLEFSKQADVQLMLAARSIGSQMSQGLSGKLAVRSALSSLLEGTGLRFTLIGKTVTIEPEGVSSDAGVMEEGGVRVAQVESQEGAESEVVDSRDGESAENEEDEERRGIPEILVTGSKVLNTDIRRTEDDVQPYVIFDRETIEHSGAANLEEFFKNQLTMNVSSLSSSQLSGGSGTSSINLRGLGSDETLILVDGRRVAQYPYDNSTLQPDLNGIPLAAIERIEVLPSTASGIYGGGATGGVINIIRRRDYVGIETALTYGNTFDSDVTSRRVDVNAGFSLEGGRTSVLLAAGYSDANPLLHGERNLIVRGREHIMLHNPATLMNAARPVLGATTNICSATASGSCGGLSLTLDDGTPLNSSITYIPEGYAGTADGGSALVGNAGQFNLDLANTAQRNGAQNGLLSTPEVKSAMVTVRRDFTSSIQGFFDLQVTDNSSRFAVNNAALSAVIPSDAPNNPFQQPIRVVAPALGFDSHMVSESKSHHAVAGAIARLPAQWQASADFTWSRSRSFSQSSDFIPALTTEADIASGALDVLRDLNEFPLTIDSESTPNRNTQVSTPREMILKDVSVRLAGPLPWALPAGDIILTTLIEHRREAINDVRVQYGADYNELYPGRNQSVDSLYIEATVPLVSARNRLPGVESLELQLATRRDEYRVRGEMTRNNLDTTAPVETMVNRSSSTDPTLGLQYQPIRDVTFRGSYATGYRPPTMFQLVPDTFSFPEGYFGFTDPLRGNEVVGPITWIWGGNPNLRSEISDSWSAGAIVTPRWLPQLRLSVDWNRIKKSDNINDLFIGHQGALDEALQFYPERITRGPASDGFEVGPIIAVDSTSINIARLDVEAVDFKLDYQWDTSRLGNFGFSAGATRLIHAQVKLIPTAEPVEYAGYSSIFISDSAGGAAWKANATLDWARGGWTLGWRTRFFDSYFANREGTADLNQGSAKIESQTYHDLFGNYRFDSAPGSTMGLLADTEVQFSVTNIFNEMPPVEVTVPTLGLFYSTLGDPRGGTYSVTIRKHFDVK